MKNYFKIVHGFNAEENITIGEDELEQAIYAHVAGKKMVLKNGISLSAGVIRLVVPDYHKTMGWNPGYKLGAEDYAELERTGTDKRLKMIQANAKERVIEHMRTGKIELIGIGAKGPPEVDAPESNKKLE